MAIFITVTASLIKKKAQIHVVLRNKIHIRGMFLVVKQEVDMGKKGGGHGKEGWGTSVKQSIWKNYLRKSTEVTKRKKWEGMLLMDEDSFCCNIMTMNYSWNGYHEQLFQVGGKKENKDISRAIDKILRKENLLNIGGLQFYIRKIPKKY